MLWIALLGLGLDCGVAVGASEPCLVGSNRVGPARGIAASGSVAYLAAGGAILALDLSNPSEPSLLGRLDLDFVPLDIASAGSLLAIAAGEKGLVLIDASDPKKLRIASRLDFDGQAVALDLQPPLALVAQDGDSDGVGGLLVVDLTNPETPVLRSSTQLGASGAVEVTSWSHYAFVAGFGVQILDISDPDQPIQVGSFHRAGSRMLASPSGRRLYSLAQSNPPQDSFVLDVIDVSNPTSPFLVRTFPAVPDPFEGLAVGGGYLYTIDRQDGLLIYKVGDETGEPKLAGSLPGARSTSDLFLSGNQLLSAEWERGLRVVDVTTPASPADIGGYGVSAETHGVKATSTRAYLRTTTGMRVIDWTSEGDPIDVGYFATDSADLTYPWPQSEIVLAGTLAYLADVSGLRVLDISADEPVEIGRWVSLHPARSVALKEDTLYLGHNTPPFGSGFALNVLSVSDPSKPNLLGSFEDDGWWAEKLTAEGDLLAGTDPLRTGGCRLFDISDASMPSVVGSCDQGPDVLDLALSGGVLFEVTYGNLLTVDVAEPSAPKILGSLEFIEPALWSVAITPTKAYLAHQDAGFELVDTSVLTVPSWRGRIDTPGSALDVAVANGRILVADGPAGFSIYSDCVLFADGLELGDLSAWSTSWP